MKKTAKILSIIMALEMIFATAAVGVFALDEAPGAEAEQAPAVTEEVVDAEEIIEEEAAEAADEVLETVESEEALGAASLAVNAAASGNRVTLTWPEAAGVTYDLTIAGDSVAHESGVNSGYAMTVDYGATYKFTVEGIKNGSVVSKGEASVGPIAVPAPASVVGYPDYQSVTVKWSAVPGATSYVVKRNDGKTYSAGAATSFRDTGAKKDVNYSYSVQAIAGDEASGFSHATASVGRVRTCYYYCTLGGAATLRSHDKAKKKITLKKGQVIKAEGFCQGSFKFTYNGRPYEAKWFRMKKVKGQIKKNAYVNGYTAEAYVNNGNFKSKTNYLIWINIYSQRVFVFQNVAGRWSLVNKNGYAKSDSGTEGYLCGSGKAKFPTPTGMNKKLHKKMKKYSKHKWWNCFSGTNAIHGSNGKKEVKKLGKLISNGCVRVTNAQAIWVFNNVPVKTRVIVF